MAVQQMMDAGRCSPARMLGNVTKALILRLQAGDAML